MSNVKVTAKGTELPLLNLKGKPYLQVAHRIVWFREEHPNGRIITSILTDIKDDFAVVRAEIYTADSILVTAVKREDKTHFPDYLEKAETGAIGRALALAGYGTQFEPEFDEGERLADAPIPIAKKQKQEIKNIDVVIKDKEKCLKYIRLFVARAQNISANDLIVKLKKEFNFEGSIDSLPLDVLEKIAKLLFLGYTTKPIYSDEI